MPMLLLPVCTHSSSACRDVNSCDMVKGGPQAVAEEGPPDSQGPSTTFLQGFRASFAFQAPYHAVFLDGVQ